MIIVFMDICNEIIIQSNYITSANKILPKYHGLYLCILHKTMIYGKERNPVPYTPNSAIAPTEQGSDLFYTPDDDLDGSPDHTAIVEKVKDGRVYTVEGNYNDKVATDDYAISYPYILGYGVPQY